MPYGVLTPWTLKVAASRVTPSAAFWLAVVSGIEYSIWYWADASSWPFCCPLALGCRKFGPKP